MTGSPHEETHPLLVAVATVGIARLERHVVTRSSTGVKVVALRITVLDGSGAVIDLGEAQLKIHRLPH